MLLTKEQISEQMCKHAQKKNIDSANSVNANSCSMSDNFRTFAMRFLTSFPPNLTFSRGSGDFLFLFAKIRISYHIRINLLKMFRQI